MRFSKPGSSRASSLKPPYWRSGCSCDANEKNNMLHQSSRVGGQDTGSTTNQSQVSSLKAPAMFSASVGLRASKSWFEVTARKTSSQFKVIIQRNAEKGLTALVTKIWEHPTSGTCASGPNVQASRTGTYWTVSGLPRR